MKKFLFIILFLGSLIFPEKKEAQVFNYIYNPLSGRYYLTSTSSIFDTTIGGSSLVKLNMPLWTPYINLNSKIFLKDTTVSSVLSLWIDRPLFFTNVPSGGFLRGAWIVDTSITGDKIKNGSVSINDLTSGAKDSIFAENNLAGLNSRLTAMESDYYAYFNGDGSPKGALLDTSIFAVVGGKIELRDGQIPPGKLDTSLTPNFKLDTLGSLKLNYDTLYFKSVAGSIIPKTKVFLYWADTSSSLKPNGEYVFKYGTINDTMGFAFLSSGYITKIMGIGSLGVYTVDYTPGDVIAFNSSQRINLIKSSVAAVRPTIEGAPAGSYGMEFYFGPPINNFIMEIVLNN